MTDLPRWASRVASGLIASGVTEVVYVPDSPLSHLVRALGPDGANVRTTIATREEEAIGVAAGLYLGGVRPAVLFQSSGLGNSTNAVASLLIPYRIPAILVISMRGEEGEWNAAQAPMGKAVRPILDALGIVWVAVEDEREAEAVVRVAGTRAFDTRIAVACLLPRRLTAAGAVRGVIA